jgi:hypothetical protein
MARNQATVNITTDSWTELTGGDATKVSFQIVTPEEKHAGVYIRTTDNATAPTANYGWVYLGYYGESNVLLTELNIGSAVPKRVWAKGIKSPCVMFVSDNSL